MYICHQQHQIFEGRVVLRGDSVTYDSGAHAVFTEQGSSASQVTSAKVTDVVARLPGCAGQVADAMSAYTQARMEDAAKLLKITESEFPDVWIRLPEHKWPKSWSNIEDPVVFSTTFVRTPTRRLFVGKTVRRSSSGNLMGKSTEL